MTGFTDVTGVDVVCGFTGCIGAVMAADTVAGHTAVIKGRTGECTGVVAIFTGITALNVVSRFARCGGAVMTADAAPLDFTVIDLRNGCPVRGGVAGFTDIRRADMAAMLAGCIGAVVAGYAIAGDTRMIKSRCAPAAGIVAVITAVTAGDVIGGFAGRFIAIMTADTGADHFTVIHA